MIVWCCAVCALCVRCAETCCMSRRNPSTFPTDKVLPATWQWRSALWKERMSWMLWRYSFRSSLFWTRKPSWRKGYAQQRHHSKMAVSRHLGFYRTGIRTIRSASPENPCLEPNMEWIGCTICEIFTFKLYCDLETGVWDHSRSSKTASLDRPTPKTWT